MSTNFYYTPLPPCNCCNREYPEIHIGKRSAGWKFNIYAPDDKTYRDVELAILNSYSIRDEYDTPYTPTEMLDIIESWQTGRSMAEEYPGHSEIDYTTGYNLTRTEFS